MRKRLLLFGIAIVAMTTSCYGPDDSVYTDELDVVYSSKPSDYDFDNGGWDNDTKKTKFHISSTVTVIDSKGKDVEMPGGDSDIISNKDAERLISNVRRNMESLGWIESTNVDPGSQELKELVLTKIIVSKTTYSGGGYYPGYPGWGWGYPGYGGWYPYYYSYSTGSVIVQLAEAIDDDPRDEGDLKLIWNALLSGYARSGIKIGYIESAIDQGFDQSSTYLQR